MLLYFLAQHAATFKHGPIFEVLGLNIEIGILPYDFFHILERATFFFLFKKALQLCFFFSLHLIHRQLFQFFYKWPIPNFWLVSSQEWLNGLLLGQSKDSSA